MNSNDDVPAAAESRLHEARAMMTEEVFEEMLHTQAKVDPGDLTTMLNLLALGITNSAWRNSCIEDWHARGRLSDCDMMRVNSHTTHAIRLRLTGWIAEFGITSLDRTALAKVDVEDVDILAHRLFRWLTKPDRKLATGMTLGELAHTEEELEQYETHADHSLGAFAGQMESKGVRFGLLYTACHGALACSGWWAHPTWPDRVERFISVLDDLSDPHWGPDGVRRERLGAEPTFLVDRRALRNALLTAPWELDGTVAEWIINAGIGYLTPVA